MTIVYANTDQPFSQWKPQYKIVATHESGSIRFVWLPYYTISVAEKLAKSLSKEYEGRKRFNMHRTTIPRYKKEYIESAAVILRSMGYTVEIAYQDFQDNPCHIITVRRR